MTSASADEEVETDALHTDLFDRSSNDYGTPLYFGTPNTEAECLRNQQKRADALEVALRRSLESNRQLSLIRATEDAARDKLIRRLNEQIRELQEDVHQRANHECELIALVRRVDTCLRRVNRRMKVKRALFIDQGEEEEKTSFLQYDRGDESNNHTPNQPVGARDVEQLQPAKRHRKIIGHV